ncbi:MAG: hypothetical protein R3B99_11360 [Polyangiales bacterium]
MPVPRAHLRDRLRLVIAALVGLAVLLVLRWDGFADAGGFEASLVEALAERVDVDPSSALRFGEGGVLRYEPVIFRGTVEEGGPADLFFVEVRAAEDGTVLSTRHLSNLTRTSSADELAPQRVGPHHAVFVAKVGGQFDAVTMLDLRGEPEAVTHGWPARARAQNAITNLQETGRGVGFGRRRYAIRPTSEHRTRDRRGPRAHDPRRGVGRGARSRGPRSRRRRRASGTERTREGMPGTITWVVDWCEPLVRRSGADRLARVARVRSEGHFDRAYYAAAGGPDTEAEVAAEMGVTEEEARQRAELSATDPELAGPRRRSSRSSTRPRAAKASGSPSSTIPS